MSINGQSYVKHEEQTDSASIRMNMGKKKQLVSDDLDF